MFRLPPQTRRLAMLRSKRERMAPEERAEWEKAMALSLAEMQQEPLAMKQFEPNKKPELMKKRVSAVCSNKQQALARAKALKGATRAITLKGARLAWAILKKIKRVENRHFNIRPGWYAAAQALHNTVPSHVPDACLQVLSPRGPKHREHPIPGEAPRRSRGRVAGRGGAPARGTGGPDQGAHSQ